MGQKGHMWLLGKAGMRKNQPGSLGRPSGLPVGAKREQENREVPSCDLKRTVCLVRRPPKWLAPHYLLGSVAHVHCIINPVFQEAPSVLKVWGGVLHHHQLGRVVDASQHSAASVPVELQRNPPRSNEHGPLLLRAGGFGGNFYPEPQALMGSLLISSFPHRHMFLWTTQLFPNVAGHQNHLGH